MEIARLKGINKSSKYTHSRTRTNAQMRFVQKNTAIHPSTNEWHGGVLNLFFVLYPSKVVQSGIRLMHRIIYDNFRPSAFSKCLRRSRHFCFAFSRRCRISTVDQLKSNKFPNQFFYNLALWKKEKKNKKRQLAMWCVSKKVSWWTAWYINSVLSIIKLKFINSKKRKKS